MEEKSLKRLEQILLIDIQNDEEINVVDKMELLINFKLLLEDYDNAILTLQQNKQKQRVLKK